VVKTIGMQYKITLPKDYDMDIIRNRVRNNGYKTDRFPGLLFKMYLMTEKPKGQLCNSYAPLYIWESHEGMNQFIFEGYFDNILESFGWQHIHIGVPLRCNLVDDISETKYVMETTGSIREASSLKDTSFDTNHMEKENMIGDLLVYNPDKWAYSHFRFFRNKPSIHQKSSSTIYQVLHISQKAN